MPTLIREEKFVSGATWDGSADTPTIGASPAPPSGGNSLQCNAIGEYVYWLIPDSGFTRCVLGTWVWVDTDPTVDSLCFKIDAGPSEGWFGLHPVVDAGKIEWYIRANGTPSMGNIYSAPAQFNLQEWTWCQVMYDVSANPWELRSKVGSTVVSTTGAAAASNLNPGLFLLGNTAGGSAYTVYFGHMKAGVAATDDDWWDAPLPARGYQRLYGPALLGSAAADLYTVPPGARTTIRHVHINNPSGGTVKATLSIGNDAADTRILNLEDIVPGGTYDRRLGAWQPLTAGEKIQGYADVGATAVITIDGYVEAA